MFSKSLIAALMLTQGLLAANYTIQCKGDPGAEDLNSARLEIDTNGVPLVGTLNTDRIAYQTSTYRWEAVQVGNKVEMVPVQVSLQKTLGYENEAFDDDGDAQTVGQQQLITVSWKNHTARATIVVDAANPKTAQVYWSLDSVNHQLKSQTCDVK